MDKNTSTLSNRQEKLLFSLPDPLSNKKVKVDFSSPDISSNGGLSLFGSMKGSFAEKMSSCIPDYRNESFISHTYREMVCQRIGQILCGYEDANDCNLLRGDSSLKMSVGRLPSGNDLSSQPTMTRLENNVSKRTLYNIGMVCAAINTIICQSGIDVTAKRHGPHSLRHSLASAMLDGGTMIPVISESLGHRSTETTLTYLKIDIKSLLKCALPVPPV